MKLSKAPEVTLLGWGGVLNGVWEFLHSPLYTDHARGAWYIIWTRLHCTVGDLMILLAAFWVTCLVFRTRYWIRQPRASAALLFLGIGLCYTVYSEWYNTTVSKTWQYTPLMPVVFGIGLSPLLQWLLIPPISLWGVRRSMIVRSGKETRMGADDRENDSAIATNIVRRSSNRFLCLFRQKIGGKAVGDDADDNRQ